MVRVKILKDIVNTVLDKECVMCKAGAIAVVDEEFTWGYTVHTENDPSVKFFVNSCEVEVL